MLEEKVRAESDGGLGKLFRVSIISCIVSPTAEEIGEDDEREEPAVNREDGVAHISDNS
jgi:hypothetical protein